MNHYISLLIIYFTFVFSVGYSQDLISRDTLNTRKAKKSADVTSLKTGDNEIQEILYTSDGATYLFRSDKVIDFKNKSNIIFPDGATVLLTETRDNNSIEAELRVQSNDYRLLLIREGNMLDYYKDESEWLTNFLKNIVRSQHKGLPQNSMESNNDVTARATEFSKSGFSSNNSSYTGDNLKSDQSIDVFLNVLKDIKMEQSRMELLSSKIEKGINPKDQKKIIGFIFGNFLLEENKVKLLGQLIDNPSYIKTNNDYLISFLDQLKFESNKVFLLKKIIKQD
jgi:hypothetical protein